ncbi:MAG: TIGR02996 domain-containing protein, partial [Polyangiaceae bacterium]|nr:TIGR02996 domain-containing protein [Polyangiaceae bacterium]
MADDRNDVAPAEQALLDAIAAEPKNDAPRLAYAAWVAPDDPELAEFIRLDCEHIRDSPPGTLRRKGPRLAELERKVSSALSRKGFQPAFVRRGFVEGGILSSDALVDRADALFDRAPALRELTLRPKNEHLAALSRLPHFGQITSLKIEVSNQVVPYTDGRRKPYSAADVLDDEALALFVASPHVRSVEALSFACASVGPETARALAESTALANLRSLCIEDDTSFDTTAANALATRPAREALTSIRIKFSNLGPEG